MTSILRAPLLHPAPRDTSTGVTRINEFRALPDRREELRVALASVLAEMRRADGCISCRLLESESDPFRFVVFEVWRDRPAHEDAVSRIPREAMLRTMTLLAEVPHGDYFVERS